MKTKLIPYCGFNLHIFYCIYQIKSNKQIVVIIITIYDEHIIEFLNVHRLYLTQHQMKWYSA